MNAYNDQPDIMAIGDSMYQGIRSLSFLPAMTQHSVPMQVAAAIGMTMVAPDLKQPLLFDMEAEFDKGGLGRLVLHIRDVCLANLAFWPFDQPWSEHEAFDNVAIGGAGIASLWEDTDAGAFDRAKALAAALRRTDLSLNDLASTIGELWYNLNTAYTLNPRHRAGQRGKSQLQQAIDRQPRILLINIGSNEGLFTAGFAGDFSDAALAGVRAIPDKMQDLADRLKALPDRTERVVFNTLIRPRFVPNLMPDPSVQNKFPGDLYFHAYGPRIGSGQQDISDAQLIAFDKLIDDVNKRTQDIMRTALGGRVAFADIYNKSLPFDGKHYMGRGLEVPGRDRKLDNRPITPVPLDFLGGFAGMDNMHPTVPGYAVLADVVLDALGRTDIRTDKAAAFAADTLLTNFRGLPALIVQGN